MSTETFTDAQASQYKSILKIVDVHKARAKMSALYILRPTADAAVNSLRAGVMERLRAEGFTIEEPIGPTEDGWLVYTISWTP